ncbi:MAG: chorismate synthase [Firmicutes bacterium]|nr:chorismate synthase [Bacillota bacterium]
MLRFLTAGESHGPGLTAILEGMPAGVDVSVDELREQLARRRRCYGRGARAGIENDEVMVTGGIHKGKTTGAPISVFIPNKDYPNWVNRDVPITAPRPGHADLAGAVKYGFADCRPVAERASARETAARVVCAYFARKLLDLSMVHVVSWVTSIGGVEASLPSAQARMTDPSIALVLARSAESSPLRCPDPAASTGMAQAIDQARDSGDSLGGVFEVAALNVPPGLGSYVHWDRRLDARLAAAVMSIGSVKAVEIGEGFALAQLRGSATHDHIVRDPESGAEGAVQNAFLPHYLRRSSNRAGGIEGGVTNGEPVFVRAAVKPVPTLQEPLPSVDLQTGQCRPAHRERSDVCIVGSAAVVAEAMIALVIADAWLERFGGDVIRADDLPQTDSRAVDRS